MASTPSLSEQPLLESRCRWAGRHLFFGCARLYHDRIVLSGWTLAGRYGQVVPLNDVARLQWWSNAPGVNVAFYLRDDSVMSLKLDAGGLWKYVVEDQLGHQASPSPELPGTLSEASAA